MKKNTEAKWILRNTDADTALMSDVLKISETASVVLANRGIRSKNAAVMYLNPLLKFLSDITVMKDVCKAIDIISESISRDERIAVYGDYDVDGVMSTVILYKTLKRLGADVYYYIPDRESEGYGLNTDALYRLREEDIDLVISCDNGIAALKEALVVKELGMRLIIIDHHEPGFLEDENGNRTDVVPDAAAVVDPKQQSCPYPFKHMCAAGICYRFAIAMLERVESDDGLRDELLALASIATFCDIVPLHGENRIIAANGLDILNKNKDINTGLFQLMAIKNISDKKIGAFDAGFIIGPCINATGRLERAALSVDLLLTDDMQAAVELARRLSELNDERKLMTEKAVRTAMDTINTEAEQNDKVMVIYDEAIHESIAGIVAGRIKDHLCHPVIVLTKSEEHAKGSARSIDGYNIFEELYKNRELFERFGGHAMAAGLTLRHENIDILRKRLNDSCLLTDESFTETIYIDKLLELDDATYRLAEELSRLAPFGKDNREPLFRTDAVVVEELRAITEKNTLIFSFALPRTHRKIKAICFGMCDKFAEMLGREYDEYTCRKILAGVLRNTDLMLDIVYSIEINEYNGNVSVQLKLKDFRLNAR